MRAIFAAPAAAPAAPAAPAVDWVALAAAGLPVDGAALPPGLRWEPEPAPRADPAAEAEVAEAAAAGGRGGQAWRDKVRGARLAEQTGLDPRTHRLQAAAAAAAAAAAPPLDPLLAAAAAATAAAAAAESAGRAGGGKARPAIAFALGAKRR
jgi:hypothetical protein